MQLTAQRSRRIVQSAIYAMKAWPVLGNSNSRQGRKQRDWKMTASYGCKRYSADMRQHARQGHV